MRCLPRRRAAVAASAIPAVVKASESLPLRISMAAAFGEHACGKSSFGRVGATQFRLEHAGGQRCRLVGGFLAWLQWKRRLLVRQQYCLRLPRRVAARLDHHAPQTISRIGSRLLIVARSFLLPHWNIVPVNGKQTSCRPYAKDTHHLRIIIAGRKYQGSRSLPADTTFR